MWFRLALNFVSQADLELVISPYLSFLSSWYDRPMPLGTLIIQQKGEGSYGMSYVRFCFVSLKKLENLGMMIYPLNPSTQEAEVGS